MTIHELSLTEALERLAPGASAYAAEDTIGGYHSDKARSQYPSGAIWAAEGQMLYALARHFKPRVVLELGTGRGVSTLHLAAAIERNANGAVLTSVDSGASRYQPARTNTARYVHADAVSYLEAVTDDSVDFIFEDLDHTAASVEAVARLATVKLAPGGILISHDAAHYNVGAAVRAGYAQAGLDIEVYRTPPCDCGLSFWRKPLTGEAAPDYDELTVTELKALLRERGIDAPARAKKDVYIQLLKG